MNISPRINEHNLKPIQRQSSSRKGWTNFSLSRPYYTRNWIFLPICMAFAVEIFFSVSTAIGYSYGGSQESLSYWIFQAGLASLCVAFVSVNLLFGYKLNIRQSIIILLPIFIMVILMIETIFQRTESTSWKYFSFFLVFSAPAAVSGVFIASRDHVKRFSLVLDPLMLVLSSGALAYVMANALSGWEATGLGGATYQTASYIAALAFNINLYHLIFGTQHIRWRFFRSRLFVVLSCTLLPAQLICVLLSGGRGGFVLLCATSAGLLLLGLRKSKVSFLGRFIGVGLVMILAAYLSLPWLSADASRQAVVNRVFSYIGEDGIDWEGTSNRDLEYANALDRIDLSPVLGHGLFNWAGEGYAHNIFLDWMLNGGVLYLLFGLVVVGALVVRIVRLSLHSPELLILVPLLMYPLVMLLFSGTYWTSGPFWLALSIIFCLEQKESSTLERKRHGRPLCIRPALRN